jgi:hypothetical protein
MRHTPENHISRLRAEQAAPPATLADFLPKTFEERMAKLTERMTQRWPTFHRHGEFDDNCLFLVDHEPGTVVRFFGGAPLTFDSLGAVKHGPFWCLSREVDGLQKWGNRQMQNYLRANRLHWVVML